MKQNCKSFHKQSIRKISSPEVLNEVNTRCFRGIVNLGRFDAYQKRHQTLFKFRKLRQKRPLEMMYHTIYTPNRKSFKTTPNFLK